MLEHVDLTLSLSKDEYKQRLKKLQARFYELAHAMFLSGIPSMVLFEGWAASGKGSTISVLTERLDARGFRVEPVSPPRTFETQYPWLWRFWLKIPAAGQMVIFDQSWYRRVLIERMMNEVSKSQWSLAYQDVADFEEQLAQDGTAIVKFWLHISRKEQTKRLKKLLKNKLTSWQVSEEDSAQNDSYKKYLKAAEYMLSRTDLPFAPWTIVEATNKYFTRVKVYETLIRIFSERLASRKRRERSKNA